MDHLVSNILIGFDNAYIRSYGFLLNRPNLSYKYYLIFNN